MALGLRGGFELSEKRFSQNRCLELRKAEAEAALEEQLGVTSDPAGGGLASEAAFDREPAAAAGAPPRGRACTTTIRTALSALLRGKA